MEYLKYGISFLSLTQSSQMQTRPNQLRRHILCARCAQLIQAAIAPLHLRSVSRHRSQVLQATSGGQIIKGECLQHLKEAALPLQQETLVKYHWDVFFKKNWPIVLNFHDFHNTVEPPYDDPFILPFFSKTPDKFFSDL